MSAFSCWSFAFAESLASPSQRGASEGPWLGMAPVVVALVLRVEMVRMQLRREAHLGRDLRR
jgi:hypothetical protein